MGTLYKRKGRYYASFKDEAGTWCTKSTGTSDKKAAEARLREFERRAADPAHEAAHQTTLREAVEGHLRARRLKGRAEGTLQCYRVKAGHLLRIVGAETPLARIDSRATEMYVEQRLDEGAANSTILKELTVLRGTLKRAKKLKMFSADLSDVLPDDIENDYKPRERYLTIEEVHKLLPELTSDQAARVCFCLGTSARWGETERAVYEDIDIQTDTVRLRGTKTVLSARVVPVVGPAREMVDYAWMYAEGTGPLLFKPWNNVRRDLRAACKRAGIPPVSPNDLRRTTASWLVQAGVGLHAVSRVLGHKDTRMVDRVYGRMGVDDLRAQMVAKLEPERASVECRKYAESGGDSEGSEVPMGRSSVDQQNEETPSKEGVSGDSVGAQRQNRTADTGIFNPGAQGRK